MEFKTIYGFDEKGFFQGERQFQVLEGVFLPDNCTDVPLPDAVEANNFFQWDGEAWQVIPKPTTAAELEGVVIDHHSDTPHDTELRALMISLTAGSKTHRLIRGTDNSWSVVKITDQEKDAQAAQAALTDFDAQISSLKDRMSLAMLRNDQEQIAALQLEYQTLMNTATLEEMPE